VRAGTQEIDLDQVRGALQHLLLLAEVGDAPRAGVLVGGAEDLNHGDHPLLRLAVEDGEIGFVDVLDGNTDPDRGIALGQEERRAAVSRAGPLNADVGAQRAVRAFEVHAFLDGGDVPRPEPRLKLIADVDDQGRMHARPEGRLLQVRVHAGEDHAHG
jgi:hypothetical protein